MKRRPGFARTQIAIIGAVLLSVALAGCVNQGSGNRPVSVSVTKNMGSPPHR